MKKLFVVLTLGAWVGTSTLAQVKVGDVAPDFSLHGSDGKTYKLADFRGKKGVVLAWFPKAFTPGCTAECKFLRDTNVQLRSGDVALFAASVDDAGTNRKFAESFGFDFPILSDPTKATAQAYGVLNTERGFANRVTFYIGKDGKIAFIDQGVQPSSHGPAVAQKAKELGLTK